MNIKNKFLVGLCAVFLISILNGCGVSKVSKVSKVSNENKDEYSGKYNDNETIAQKAENHTHTTYNIIKNSDNILEFQYGGFQGVDTIWILKSNDDSEITLDYDSQVDSGDFKAVLVNQEKEIQNILEGSSRGNKTIKLAKGEHRLKFVGSNANGKVKVSITKSKNVEIKSSIDKN